MRQDQSESGRQNPDHRCRLTFDRDGGADDARVGAEGGAPQRVAEDHRRSVAGEVVLLAEVASELRLDDAVPSRAYMRFVLDGAREHVLPPRLGGALALLEGAPDADIVFCAHTGLEGAASLTDIRNGELVGRVVKIAYWRVPRSEVPRATQERTRWLLEKWSEVDDWIGRARAS